MAGPPLFRPVAFIDRREPGPQIFSTELSGYYRIIERKRRRRALLIGNEPGGTLDQMEDKYAAMKSTATLKVKMVRCTQSTLPENLRGFSSSFRPFAGTP